MRNTIDARVRLMAAILGACCLLSPILHAKDIPGPAGSALDRGFTGLYNLDFGGAQEDFAAWQRLHPDDPMGTASEAAGFLFCEVNRLGGLEAKFQDNGDWVADRRKLPRDPALQSHFQDAIARTEKLAHA